MPDDEIKKIQARVSSDAHRNVRLYAAQNALNMEEVVVKGLRALGIDARAAALGERVRGDRNRLIDDMGTLFRVLGVRHQDWPAAAGFA